MYLYLCTVLSADEPTTGMDPKIRREIWNLILRMKEDRLIIMTTHVRRALWCIMYSVDVSIVYRCTVESTWVEATQYIHIYE